MATFYCEQCGTLCIDTLRGYISGCEHYPADIRWEKLGRKERALVRNAQALARHEVDEETI